MTLTPKEELYWKRVENLKKYLKKVDKKLPMMYNMMKLKLIMLMAKVKDY
jgi:hypothetical protein|tara:strand:- start:526 stop:675 length:150 start_codon:yes stop_codon:yes gene_type:complete